MTKARLPLPLKLAALLATGIIVGFLLLLAVFTLPTEPIARNVLASLPAYNGEWGLGEEAYEQLVKGYKTTQLDNSTDSAMMLAAMHTCDEPLATRVVEAYRYQGDGTAYQTLLEYGRDGGAGLSDAPIARYWHGYLALLKPLLSFMSYMDIRVLLMLVQGAMLIAVVAGMCRRRLYGAVAGFALSLVCITPSVTGFSLQFSTAFMVFLAAMLVLLYLPAERWSMRTLPVFFMLCGMTVCYVDYLTYPIAAFGMPFALVVLMLPERSAKREWSRFIGCGLCWALGYFGMWAGKWLLVLLFGNEQHFLRDLFAKVAERSGTVTAESALTFLAVLKAQLSVFVKKSYLVAAVAAILGYAVLWLKLRRRGTGIGGASTQISRRLVLLAVALLPFVWYLFTQNHSYQHAFFTSRGLAVTVFALAAALMPAAALDGSEAPREGSA